MPDPIDLLVIERAGAASQLCDWFGSVDSDAPDAELGEDWQAVGVGEAESATEFDVLCAGIVERGWASARKLLG